jgi:hypothetical protein
MQNGFKRICCEVHATYSISDSLLSNRSCTADHIYGNIAVNDGKWHYVGVAQSRATYHLGFRQNQILQKTHFCLM